MRDGAEMEMVMPDLVCWGEGGGGPRLSGSICSVCNYSSYPCKAHCSECCAPMTPMSFDGTGTIYSFTVVRVKPPLGLPQPYTVAYIDLDHVPLRIFGLLDTKEDHCYAIGERVLLATGELGNDAQGVPCLRPFFQSVESSNTQQSGQ